MDETQQPVLLSSSHSTEIGEIAGALSKAQGEYPTLKRSASMKLHGQEYRYSTLDDVQQCIRGPFAKHGLCFTQLPGLKKTENGAGVVVTTILAHSSGQWFRSDFLMPTKVDPHGIGSSLTYTKKYALGSMAGVASEADDDGNHAQHPRGQGGR